MLNQHGFYLPCLIVMPEEASMMICLADQQTLASLWSAVIQGA